MATLTLRNVPDELVARLKARAKRHRRSLYNETIAALELADATLTAATPPLAAATMAPDWETALVRVREIQARFPGAANAAHQPRDLQELQEELDLFARLRSQFKGPPLTSAAIIAAIDRDSHPPEPPGLAAAEKVSH
jgi:plasmid stability protein